MHKKRFKLLPLTAAVLFSWAGAATALDFTGYFRSGIGRSSKDGGLECFKLPGVIGNGNFRLGNECETYGEVELDQGVYDGKDGVKFDAHFMFAYVTNQQGDFEAIGNTPGNNNQWANRQAWVEAKSLPFLAGGSAWVGKRYYQRHDVHINDFFYWNDSGPGAGVEKIKLGGDLTTSFAFFTANSNNGFNSNPPSATNAANDPNRNATTQLDWRIAGIGLGPAGALEFGVLYNKADTQLPNSKDGTAVMVEHTIKVLGGINKLFLTVGTGSTNMGSGGQSPVNQPGNQDGAKGIVEWLVIQPSPMFSAGVTAGYYDFKNNYKWTWVGGRPVFHVNEYFKVQAEAGYNRIKATSQSDAATLSKFTIAPTIVAGNGFWSRPELRLFYTYAKWNSKARDGVFGPGAGTIAGGTAGPFGLETKGSTYGFQVEAWW